MSNKIVLEITISHDDNIDECIDVKDIIIDALDDLELDGKFDAVEIGSRSLSFDETFDLKN